MITEKQMSVRPQLLGRNDIVEMARTWLGTPYRHQASCRGAGCDCLGLLLGIWREVAGCIPENPPPYSALWREVGGGETLLAAAGRHMIVQENGRPGDVVIFRMQRDTPAKHVGIISAHDHFIHAYQGNGVVETSFSDFWRKAIAGTFSFPFLAQAEA